MAGLISIDSKNPPIGLILVGAFSVFVKTENFADLRLQLNLAAQIHHKAAEGLVGGEPEGAPDLHLAAGQQVARVVDAVLVLCPGYRDGGISAGRGRVGGEGYLGRGSNSEEAQPGL